MGAKSIYIIAFFLLHNFTALFCNACENDIIPDMPNVLHEIVIHSPEVINRSENGKLYLEKQRIFLLYPKTCLLAGNSQNWHLPTEAISIDDEGVYIPVFSGFLEKKVFIQKCNNCLYEWEAKWYESRCPRCRSTDISNILSHLL